MPTLQQEESSQPWHALSLDELRAHLQTTTHGLTADEASARLQKVGPNRLPPPRKRGPMRRFLLQFHNLLIYLLLGSSVITAILQHWVDTAVIIGVVVINAIIGFIQEGKAEKALDAIRSMLSLRAQVLRDRVRAEIAADEIVPGDYVFLEPGDKVPADIRLHRIHELHVDEAALTGESVPVTKHTDAVAPETVLGDRTCMAYSGTLVTAGYAEGVVVATGNLTELGRISSMLSQVSELTTPLIRQLNDFGRVLTVAIVLLALLTFGYGVVVQEHLASDMFLAAVGLAVAAIPEGLPAVVTIALAIGVQRMAQRKAIIRRLPAVETLGSVTVICSDKTGTLTRNEMTVQMAATAAGIFSVTGTGYAPKGDILLDQQKVDPQMFPVLCEMAQAALLCNDAVVTPKHDAWQAVGDPTEAALVTFAHKVGLEAGSMNGEYPRRAVIPFASEHRYMATLHSDALGHGVIYAKGAPEKLLQMCKLQRMRGEDSALDQVYWESIMARFAESGQRLLAVASKALDAPRESLTEVDLAEGLSLLGIVGMSDPPRDEAIHAIAQCQSAGIRVKMITGDHAATAKAIGEKMGLSRGQPVLTGQDLEALSEQDLRLRVMETDIFARASPEHKLRLVTALQANNQVVAMTGDGVNDAPALKRANVGVAMAIKGTEVAKEAAEMVLADDNFASISHAVEEGRTVHDNIKKSILFILPTNGGEAFTIIAAIILGTTLPITPAQILWVNMITAVTLALSLAFEPAETDVMQRPPRPVNEPLLSRLLLWRIAFVSAILVVGTYGLFAWQIQQGAEVAYARTVAVNTLVMFEVFYLFNTRYLWRAVGSWRTLVGNPYVLYAVALVILFQLLFTYWTPMQTLFVTRDITVTDWIAITLVASTVFVLVELEKLVGRRRLHGKQ